MDLALRRKFEIQLKHLEGFAFQEIVVKIFQLTYGETGFTEIRPKKDRGSDGIVEEEKRIIACYGPEEIQNTYKRQKEFKKKAESDFKQYETHWQDQYSNWSFVINHKIDPEYDKIVKSFDAKATVIGVGQLVSMIENLKNHQRRELGNRLKIESEYFSVSYLKNFLEDLLKVSETELENIKYDKNNYVPPETKIRINYSTSEVDEAMGEFELLAEKGTLKLVDDLMFTYEDEEIDRMKHKILYDYNHLTSGAFKIRLKELSEHYLDKLSSTNDDDYLHYIRAVLLYLFEQCLIGKKPNSKK